MEGKKKKSYIFSLTSRQLHRHSASVYLLSAAKHVGRNDEFSEK